MGGSVLGRNNGETAITQNPLKSLERVTGFDHASEWWATLIHSQFETRRKGNLTGRAVNSSATRGAKLWNATRHKLRNTHYDKSRGYRAKKP